MIVATTIVQGVAATSVEATANPYPLDRVLHLQDVQELGTHNSYHLRPNRALFPDEPADYTHPPLDVQLSRGMRSLELDVFNERALPVFHSIIVDDQSNCPSLAVCLGTVNVWSRANPGHLPITIFVEAKPVPTSTNPLAQQVIDNYIAQHGLVSWDAAGFARIDRTVRSAFGRTLLTPDDVRGNRATLRAAILRDGWPTLGRLRGKVLVVLNVQGAEADVYRSGAPSLQGKPMFVVSSPTEPSAAVISRDRPAAARLRALVRRHFLVRTRADADAAEARANDLTRAETTLASGATIVATDYPVPDPTIGPYVVDLPGTAVARCNPVTAPKRCRDRDLENPAGLHAR